MTAERDIESYLVRRCKARPDVECRKVKWIGVNGAPDRLVMARDCNAIFAELKATGKKPKAHQLREHERMRAAGQIVVVIDSIAKVDKLFELIDNHQKVEARLRSLMDKGAGLSEAFKGRKVDTRV